MLKKKKKKEEKEIDINRENYFSKENIVKEQLRNRSLKFFKVNYQKNLNYGIVFAILTCFFATAGHVTIHTKNKEHKIFLTNINGQSEKYDAGTEERKKTLQERRNYIRNKGNK